MFKCPRRRLEPFHDGSSVICFVCVNCTFEGGGCSCGLGHSKYNDLDYWKTTPEISRDLYDLISALYGDRDRLNQIKEGLGIEVKK
ncbi:MAG: hypothetical protein ACTSRU_16210 [Candidatus Hodarchaeales archaeon]